MEFKLVALKEIAKIIGDYKTGSEITDLFKRAGFPEIMHDGTTKWRFLYSTFEELQKEKDGFNKINKIIETFCDPQEYFSNPEDYETISNKINHILSFYGLKIRNDGKIIKIDNVETEIKNTDTLFNSRNYPEVIKKNGKSLFDEGRYFHAVFECSKALEKYIQRKSKSDLSGVKLINEELSLNKSLKINSQQTETDRDEQEGIRDLCRGLMMSIRNYTAHELALEKPIPKEDALDILSLISYLYRKIDNATYVIKK